MYSQADNLEHEPTWGELFYGPAFWPFSILKWLIAVAVLSGCHNDYEMELAKVAAKQEAYDDIGKMIHGKFPEIVSTRARGDEGGRESLRFRAERPSQGKAKSATAATEKSAEPAPRVLSSPEKPQAEPPAAETRPAGPSPNPASEPARMVADDESRQSMMPATTPAMVDLRPVVYFLTATWCQPCKPVKASVEAGGFPEFQIKILQEQEWPAWFRQKNLTIPMFLISGSDGGTYWFDPTIWPASSQRNQLVKAWQRRNPGRNLNALSLTSANSLTFAQAAGSSIPEQLRKFLGDEAVITITPAQPIKTTMDDGSVLKYSKLSAHYKMIGTVPTLTIDQPQPQAWVRRMGIWWEADIQGARGNLGDVPPTATLKTSRGDVKIKIGLDPQ